MRRIWMWIGVSRILRVSTQLRARSWCSISLYIGAHAREPLQQGGQDGQWPREVEGASIQARDVGA
jgi:hypothetical protein